MRRKTNYNEYFSTSASTLLLYYLLRLYLLRHRLMFKNDIVRNIHSCKSICCNNSMPMIMWFYQTRYKLSSSTDAGFLPKTLSFNINWSL